MNADETGHEFQGEKAPPDEQALFRATSEHMRERVRYVELGGGLDRAQAKVSYFAESDRGHVAYDTDDHAVDTVIQFQHGPIGENGLNGVQNEDVLRLLIVRLQVLNERFPCRENSIAITKLEEALLWLELRTRRRREQGVEGQNLAHVS